MFLAFLGKCHRCQQLYAHSLSSICLCSDRVRWRRRRFGWRRRMVFHRYSFSHIRAPLQCRASAPLSVIPCPLHPPRTVHLTWLVARLPRLSLVREGPVRRRSRQRLDAASRISMSIAPFSELLEVSKHYASPAQTGIAHARRGKCLGSRAAHADQADQADQAGTDAPLRLRELAHRQPARQHGGQAVGSREEQHVHSLQRYAVLMAATHNTTAGWCLSRGCHAFTQTSHIWPLVTAGGSQYRGFALGAPTGGDDASVIQTTNAR